MAKVAGRPLRQLKTKGLTENDVMRANRGFKQVAYQTGLRSIARILELSKGSALTLRFQQRVLGPYVRSLCYHDVAPSQAGMFEAQLLRYKRDFVDVGLRELRELQAGNWPHERPGLMLTFDDGLRSHAEVVAPLLERHRFTGWFMLPVGFLDCDEDCQTQFARDNRISIPKDWPRGERCAMTWQQARHLHRRHVVGCHTTNHRRLDSTLGEEEVHQEVFEAKKRLQMALGSSVVIFGWVGGEKWSYSAEAAQAVRAAGFEIALMTDSAPIRPGANLMQLHRCQTEAHFSMAEVDLALSGFFDLRYLFRRAHVNRLTGVPSNSAGCIPSSLG